MIKIQIQSIIYNHNKNDILRSLDSIENAIKNEKEIYISVKYGDTTENQLFTIDDIKNINEKYSFNIEYTHWGYDKGTAKGNNDLFFNCESDFIQLIYQNVILEPSFYKNILQSLKKTNVGIIEARQVPIEQPKIYDSRTLETEWASKTCCLISTKIFKELDGFDSKTFFSCYDDLDFSWRARLNGYKIIYNPLSMAYCSQYLNTNGNLIKNENDIYHLALADILLAYKWSNDTYVNSLMNNWKNSFGPTKKALNNFIERKENNNLPKQIDSNGKISIFINKFHYHYRYII